jgi:hypothetical protein
MDTRNPTRRTLAKAAAAALAAGQAQAQQPIVIPIRVTSQVTVTEPVSDLLYGNFIELGFGRQIEGMRAEMFYNRSFEEIPPYDGAYGWIHRTREDDLSKEVWWHSGYEEEPWRAEPASPQLKFQPHAKLWFRHGIAEAVLQYGSSGPAFLLQRGIWLREGIVYRFSGYLRSGEPGKYNEKPVTVGVGLFRGENLTTPVVMQDVNVTPDWQKFSLDLPCRKYTGRAVFAVRIPGGSSVSCDAFSLMPADHKGGWRSDVIDALRRVKPGIIRFPGGCFASAHHWREGIGPSDERVPRPSIPWGGLEYNDAGTAEFVELCRIVNCEPLICVNVMSGSPAEAADWVAYCNAPVTHPLGALRAEHGYADPFHVKFWELDNEAFRKYSQAEYAEVCVKFAKAMKAVDPSIRLVMCGYWHTNATQYEELGPMLDIAGGHIDLVARRGFLGEQQRALAIIRAYNQRSGRRIGLCNTEYLPPSADVPVLDAGEKRPATAREQTLQNRQIRWKYAINTANLLLDYRSLGGEFLFSCFNNLANTWGQNVLECAKEGVWLSAAGKVFELYSSSPAKWPLKTERILPKGLRVEAAFSLDKKRLVVDVINDSPHSRKVDLDLADAGHFGSGMATTLSAADPAARNSLNNPNAISRTESHVVRAANGHTAFEAPPYCVSMIIFQQS